MPTKDNPASSPAARNEVHTRLDDMFDDLAPRPDKVSAYSGRTTSDLEGEMLALFTVLAGRAQTDLDLVQEVADLAGLDENSDAVEQVIDAVRAHDRALSFVRNNRTYCVTAIADDTASDELDLSEEQASGIRALIEMIANDPTQYTPSISIELIS